MPKELSVTLSEKQVNGLNDFLQELPAKYANPILAYLQSIINAQRKAEAEAEAQAIKKGQEPEMVLDSNGTEQGGNIEEMEPFVTK